MIIIAVAVRICRLRCPCKWGRNFFSQRNVWHSSLTFFHGVFFEILVCVSVSLSLIPFLTENFINNADRTSVGYALLFLALLIGYLLFVTYFACIKSK